MLGRSNEVAEGEALWTEIRTSTTDLCLVGLLLARGEACASPWSFINLSPPSSPLSSPPHCCCSSCRARNNGLFTGCLGAELVSVGSDTILGERCGASAGRAQPACPPHQGKRPDTHWSASQPSVAALPHRPGCRARHAPGTGSTVGRAAPTPFRSVVESTNSSVTC